MEAPRWKCEHCGLDGAELGISVYGMKKGHQLPHQYLCQGQDDKGSPLGIPVECLAPGCAGESKIRTPRAWVEHYKSRHGILIGRATDLRWLRLKYRPDLLPSYDMNASFGSYFSQRSPIAASNILRDIYDSATNDPIQASFNLEKHVRAYRREFQDYFSATPVSFHAHISDISPQLLCSIILFLEEFSPLKAKHKLSKVQKVKHMVAVCPGTYGAAYGSQTHHAVIEKNRKYACGTKSKVVDLNLTATALKEQFRELRLAGYIAIVVEIIRSSDGTLMPLEQWKVLWQSCESAGIYLLVDEALSAIRCGAPFAHQLPGYSAFTPSFILFGKGIRVCGIGIAWNGVVVNRLGYGNVPEIQEDTLRGWDMRLSEVIPPTVLAISWGTIRYAKNEDWAGRAQRIGQNLRTFLHEEYPSIEVRGTGAYLHIPRIRSGMTVVVGAASRVPAVRWLPFLDAGMDDPNLIQHLFRSTSRSLRSDLQTRVTGLCAVCADFPDGELLLCQRCFCPICEGCRNGNSPEARKHYQSQCLGSDTA